MLWYFFLSRILSNTFTISDVYIRENRYYTWKINKYKNYIWTVVLLSFFICNYHISLMTHETNQKLWKKTFICDNSGLVCRYIWVFISKPVLLNAMVNVNNRYKLHMCLESGTLLARYKGHFCRFRSDCCLTPTQQFFSYIMVRTS